MKGGVSLEGERQRIVGRLLGKHYTLLTNPHIGGIALGCYGAILGEIACCGTLRNCLCLKTFCQLFIDIVHLGCMTNVILKRRFEISFRDTVFLKNCQLACLTVYFIIFGFCQKNTLCKMIVIEYVFHLPRLDILTWNTWFARDKRACYE